MKLEHLLQAYQFNNINVNIDKEYNEKDKAVVIHFNEDINASCLLDKEGYVTAMNLFINCVVNKDKTINNQLSHTIKTIRVIQKTIELLANTKQEEANKILEELGLFNEELKGKAVRFLNYVFEIKTLNGILMFTAIEEAPLEISSLK